MVDCYLYKVFGKLANVRNLHNTVYTQECDDYSMISMTGSKALAIK